MIFEQLRRTLPAEKIQAFFQGFSIVRREPDAIEFTVHNPFTRDWIARNYSSVLQEAVTQALALFNGDRGAPAPRIKITAKAAPELRGPAVAPVPEGPPIPDGFRFQPIDRPGATSVPIASSWLSHVPGADGGSLGPPTLTAVAAGEPAGEPDADGELNPNYTFDQFVPGDCNRMAQAAAFAVGAHPGRSYNPLFIHGAVGLGKTHLLQAICHSVKGKAGRIVYVSCEEFTNRFIRAIERKSLDQFRAYHRSADLLVVDDVDFLASKERTQEEFFHMFNQLYHQGKQIVLSSDRPPAEIPTLQDRLVSRFIWGLVTDIAPPGFETRVAILKRKARTRGEELPDDVAYLIAQRVDTNIRELEGALNQVLGMARMTERPVTVTLAEEALHNSGAPRPTAVTLPAILNVVTSEFSITPRELTGSSRRQAISTPRQIGMYLGRMLTKHSYDEIGRAFGRRDHTTVMYAVDRIKGRIVQDRVLRDVVERLQRRILGR
jgi:chromosomal replication initiator protein